MKYQFQFPKLTSLNIIVSILSDQPIPNVLFIKEMSKPGDRNIFISTTEMEAKHKSDTMAATIGLRKNQFVVLLIDANNPVIIQAVLKKHPWPGGKKFIVNITGGTKMMSQMVYLFFSRKSTASIYYWPTTNMHLQQLYPVIEERKIPSPIELDLRTYLLAFGYDYIAQTQFSHSFAQAEQLFEQSITAGSAGKVAQIKNASNEAYKERDKSYLTGGWFEEWLYGYLKRTLHLKDGEIAYNVKLKHNYSLRKSESDNEIDVAFIYRNRLYLWECKVYTTDNIKGKKITDPVFKIASLSQSLGLQAVSFVVIFSRLGKNREQKDFLEDITRLMRIRKIFFMEDLTDLNLFKTQISNIINYGS